MPTGSFVAYDATGTYRLDASRKNTVGAAFGAPTFLGDGRDIADVYYLTLSNVSTTNATVTVLTASGKNPYHGRVVPNVSFLGVGYETIVPGVVLPTMNTSPANGWTTTVYVGVWAGILRGGNTLGVQNSWANGRALPGLISVAAGQPGFLGKFQIRNTGADAAAESAAVLRPNAKLFDKAGPRGFSFVQVTSNAPSERVDGSGQTLPINFTFFDADDDEGTIGVKKAEGGAASTFNVIRVDDNVLLDSGELERDGTTRYQITEEDSHVDELLLVVDEAATDDSEENVLVFNKKFIWVAPDVSNSPGVWTQDRVTLTQAGQASGIVNSGGAALLWAKIEVGALASSKQNPFPCGISCEYAEVGVAAWAA